ncbi:uroporphyrinogen-III synthase [Helicobacter apodemus]|uniref:Uroporphyrinogen-III synthase n=1 Tax=Helicobacter apodemus TaxID=135569 RepID=A0A2U8FFH6_9HELI|nr:uroporphyrinogen-III synthase [Helicobacter apodemus]AWI34778.1 uroporphyrinogen-III synthase [Helicobacter apodemus]
MKKVYYITKRNTAANLDNSINLLELLEINKLQDKQLFLKLQQCNCLIFTSKNAIFALEENVGEKWHKIPCYVIGKGSNQTLEHFGVKAKFIGTQSYGDSFAMELQHQLKGKKPLFIRAKKIASSLVEILGDAQIHLLESILYETLPIKLSQTQKEKLMPQKDAILFFSAPSSVEAFLLNFQWQKDYTALCIGKTTLKYTKTSLGARAKILLSPHLSIHSSLEFAKTL